MADLKPSEIEKSDVVEVNYKELSKDSSSDDIKQVSSMKGFKLVLVRNLIKVKNHIATIPMLATVLTMVVITFSLRDHNEAIYYLIHPDAFPFLMFCNILASILSCLCYLNVSNKHSSKGKKIFMSVFYYILLIGEVIIDYLFIHHFQLELALTNGAVTSEKGVYTLNQSMIWLNVHIIFVYITIGLSIIAPIVQPYTSKIHIHIK